MKLPENDAYLNSKMIILQNVLKKFVVGMFFCTVIKISKKFIFQVISYKIYNLKIFYKVNYFSLFSKQLIKTEIYISQLNKIDTYNNKDVF